MAELDQEFLKYRKKIQYTFNPHIVPSSEE